MDESEAGSPSSIAYGELVDEHLETIYKAMVLLLGERDIAEEQTIAAFERIWEDLSQGNVFGDATEILYRAAARGAFGRLRRSSELRGHLPPTTADDRLITATGIIGEFDVQQRAAIILSALCGTGYPLAGIATGVGAPRARDLAYAARQTYRSERGGTPDISAVCSEITPLLSAQLDGEVSADEAAQIAEHLATCPVCTETAALNDELARLLNGMRLPPLSEAFRREVEAVPLAPGRKRPQGWRRVLRLMAGPAILVVALFGGLFVLQWLTGAEATIKTGEGRTSDIVYARESSDGGVLILDSGSGRRLTRLPPGLVSRDGLHLYSSVGACEASTCTSTVTVEDTGTLDSKEVGRVPGRLVGVGVDEAKKRLFLSDEAAGWGRLVAVDLGDGQVRDTWAAPPGIEAAFSPSQARQAADDSSLATLGSSSGGAAVVLTDFREGRVAGSVVIGPVREGAVELLAPDREGRVLAYENGTGRLHELEPRSGRLLRTLDVSGRAAADNPPPGGDHPEGTVASDGRGRVFAVARTGGIAVVDLARFEVASRLNADRDYNFVAVSSDGRQLYVVDRTGVYFVLDAGTGNQLLRRAPNDSGGFLQPSYHDALVAGVLQVNRGE